MRYLIAIALIFTSLSLQAEEASSFEMTRTPYTAAQHLEAGKSLIAQGQGRLGDRHLKMIFHAYPESEEIAEACYTRAVAALEAGNGRTANKWFSRYLEIVPQTDRFEEIFGYKLAIADTFCNGQKARAFEVSFFPRIISGKHYALDLYDEVYASMPSHENGAQALYGKGIILWKLREYEEAIDSMQGFIARFPRHEHAPDAYEAICGIYLDHIRFQPHNPDLLPLAQINLRKFRSDFPTDEKLLKAEDTLGEMRESLAEALVETGQFYERKGIEPAACVYYAHAANDYVETSAAEFAIARLVELESVNPLLEGLETRTSLQDIAAADLPEE